MVDAKLQQALSAPVAQKTAAAITLLTSCSAPDCITILGALVSEQTSIQDAKPILDAMVSDKLPKLKNDECEAVCSAAMDKLAPRKQFFSIEDAKFRRVLVEVYEA